MSHTRGMQPTVYILTNAKRGTLYIGVTANPVSRILQHRRGEGSAFVRRYRLYRLVYVEQYPRITDAIEREKQLKAWRRAWKIGLIEQANPDWSELWPTPGVEPVDRGSA
ncbi:GIY-YIG nuclease family protein [Thalassobaculum sp.]|uniref:GIY-YIG nuclease family protein n=1 Tax=Thalassobaculum sp. TaxID=2022740 RepID=UPI003B5B4B98